MTCNTKSEIIPKQIPHLIVAILQAHSFRTLFTALFFTNTLSVAITDFLSVLFCVQQYCFPIIKTNPRIRMKYYIKFEKQAYIELIVVVNSSLM